MNGKIIGMFVALAIVSMIALAGIAIGKNTLPLEQRPHYNAVVHEQLEDAMDAGDYAAWLRIRQENNLPMHGKMFQVVNEENFATFVRMHEANLAGDTTTADALRQELGLGAGNMHGKRGSATGQRTGMHQNCPFATE